MINELITYLDSKISGTNLIDRWGGYCELFKAKKDLPYGVGLEGDCKGNTYTYDDRNEIVAFLSLKSVTSKRHGQFDLADITFELHHFCSFKYIYAARYFMAAMELNAKLNSVLTKYKFDISFASVHTPQYPNLEYTVFSIKPVGIGYCDITFDKETQPCISQQPQ